MSGGFFRGTSADQDTRFSNKQAKLMKSQKFAPELDHLVDMGKVKMDVLKPWIATRVTELLGFEDEVLINFIYGLLDGKVVNGKEIQIQITGFMEKNTGKFMKELWVLLLSAEKNASGVPQQFLDAKEEEIRKKKDEADRITSEIQKKRKEAELEKQKKMDVDVDASKAVDDASEKISKHMLPRTDDDKGSGEENGSRENQRLSRSPIAGERLTPPRSISKSFSRSGSYSGHKSRSLSRSPLSRRHSISPERQYRSSRKRSLSPRRNRSPRRPRSPLRRRSPHSRRRSSSRSWRRSPSPRRQRSPSPSRRRSPSPARRISSSPARRRSPSPVKRRLPTPARRRTPPPIRRRSPSPSRRRSPSPIRRRSPIHTRRRSPAPSRRWSPSIRRRSPPPRRRSPSPLRRRSPLSPPLRRSPSPLRKRSPQPRSPTLRRRSPLRSPRQRQRSPYRARRSLSRDQDVRSNGFESKRYRDDYITQRTHLRRSPTPDSPGREAEHTLSRRPIILRSPQRDPKDRSNVRRKDPELSLSPEKSPSRSKSLPMSGKSSPSEDRRSPSESPVRQTRERIMHSDGASLVRQTRVGVTRHDSPKTARHEEAGHTRGQRTDSPHKSTKHSPIIGVQRKIYKEDLHQKKYTREELSGHRSGESRSRLDITEANKNDRDRKSDKASKRIDHPGSPTEEVEYSPGRKDGKISSLDNIPEKKPSSKQLESDSYSNDRLQKANASEELKDHTEKHSHLQTVVDSGRSHNNNRVDAFDSDLKGNGKKGPEHLGKRKNKRSEKHDMTSDDASSPDSEVDEKKEAKRRRKEEKRSLRKEEKRRRREERHRRREERRARKLKVKSVNTVTPPSDIEKKQNDSDDSDDDFSPSRNSRLKDTRETESETKKLEIELREKALQSLRAKKGVNP